MWQHWAPDWWLPRAEIVFRTLTAPEYSGWLLARWMTQSVFLSLLIFAADYLLGLALLALLRARLLRLKLPRTLETAVALALGSGVSACAMFALGGLRRILFPFVLGITIAAALAGLAFFRMPRLRPRWWMLALLPVLIWFVADLMMPVVEYDSTMYHMNSARWYQDTHRILYNPDIRFNAQPHLPVMLYLRHWILLGEDSLLKLQNLEFLAILALLMLSLPHGRWLALPFLFASPIFGYVARMEYADLGMTAWLAAGVALLVHQLREDVDLSIPAGLAIGFAAASKLQGLVLAACVLAGFLIVRRARAIRPVLIMGCLIVVVGAGWWGRSYINTGSPAYPFFLGSNPDRDFLFSISARYGVGRDIGALLLTPWNMLAQSPHLYSDPFIFGFPLLLLLIAAAVRWRSFRRPDALFLATTFLLFFVFWFRTGQVMRYLASVLPAMAMLFAILAGDLPRRVRIAITVFVGLLAAHAMGITTNVVRYAMPPPVTIAEKESALTGLLRYYYAVRELNRVAQPGDKAYFWFCEDAPFYGLQRNAGDWFGKHRYSFLGDGATTPAEMMNRLRRAGFRYLVVDRNRMRELGSLYGWRLRGTGFETAGSPVPSGLAKIYEDGVFTLWRLD